MSVARALTAALVVFALSHAALAECTPDCLGGGRNPATDCLVEFAGIATTDEACTDGNPSCDMDGVVDGVCTFPVAVCINVAGDPLCAAQGMSRPPGVRPARSAAGQALARALAALDPTRSGCTMPGLGVPLTASLGGIGEAVARLTISANAGRKRDRNKLRLTCRPAPTSPGLARTIAPIFRARCALPACHDAMPGSVGPDLTGPGLHDALVDVPALNVPALVLVRPGSAASSYLVRKILGKRISDGTPRMPEGCPKNAPAGGCLTQSEMAAIVAWIQTGAPDN